MDKQQSLDAIRVNPQVVYSALHRAGQEVLQAMDAIDNGNQNGAIGAIYEVPDRLETARTFCDAIMRIHRKLI